MREDGEHCGFVVTESRRRLPLFLMRRYENLLAWQKCHRLALTVYRLTDRWPRDERYGLTAQVRRAASSAAANIVEGSTRKGKREFCRFLNITLGSLSETRYYFQLAADLNIASREDHAVVEEEFGEAWALTWRLYDSMRS